MEPSWGVPPVGWAAASVCRSPVCVSPSAAGRAPPPSSPPAPASRGRLSHCAARDCPWPFDVVGVGGGGGQAGHCAQQAEAAAIGGTAVREGRRVRPPGRFQWEQPHATSELSVGTAAKDRRDKSGIVGRHRNSLPSRTRAVSHTSRPQGRRAVPRHSGSRCLGLVSHIQAPVHLWKRTALLQTADFRAASQKRSIRRRPVPAVARDLCKYRGNVSCGTIWVVH